MEEAFKDQVAPGRWMWCVIDNLPLFDDRPEYLLKLMAKMKQANEHPLISSFGNIWETVENYYHENNRFPDVDWLRLNFRNIRTIVQDDTTFSMQIYDSLVKYVDQEVLRIKINKRIVEAENPSVEAFKDLAEEMQVFSSGSGVEIRLQTDEEILNTYDDYESKFDGIKTNIKGLDEVIGVLGYQSLSAFAAPTGHGKSTFAFSLAYYAAITGKYVEYLSFEVPRSHAWFNFASIESHGTDHPLPSLLMKNKEMTREQKEWFREHMGNFLKKTHASGGGLNIIDQTESAGISTYEELCARLELLAEMRKRKADLIIVDNIDNLSTFRSRERDEITKVNNYIINLDGYCKKYYHGEGTAILLLSQVNRGAMGRLYKASNGSGKGTAKIDVTCIQKYNALYEKPTCVLIGFADESARSSGIMRIYPAKLRNGAVPETPIQLSVNYAYSKVMGDFVAPRVASTQEEYEQAMDKALDEVDDETIQDLDDLLSD